MYLAKPNGKAIVVKGQSRKAYHHPLLKEMLSKTSLLHKAKCLEQVGDAGVLLEVVSCDILSKKLFLEYLQSFTLKRLL